jgi:hypothetical protein
MARLTPSFDQLRVSTAILLCAALLGACHSSGGGSDRTNPTVTVSDPTNNAAIVGNALTVFGTASDAGGLTGVMVNGVPATSTDNFATWRTTVFLRPGTNQITAIARDAAGNVGTASITVMNETPVITFPPADAFSSGTTIDVVGSAGGMLPVSNLAVNGVAAVSDDGFAHWRATVPLVEGDNELVVTMTDPRTQTSANMTTRRLTNRLLTPVTQPSGLVLDAPNARLLVMDEGSKALYALALDTGARTVISGLRVGGGERFSSAGQFTLDAANDRVFFGDVFGLYAIRLSDGERTFVSGSRRGVNLILDADLDWPFAIFTGPSLGWPLCCSGTGVLPADFAYVISGAEYQSPWEVVVDVATGNRLSNFGVPDFNGCQSDPLSAGTIIHAQRNLTGEGYFFIKSTGDVYEVRACRQHWGDAPGQTKLAGTVDLTHRRAYVISASELHSVDLSTPLVSELSFGLAEGVAPFRLASVTIDPVVQRLYLLTTDGRILTAETDGTQLLNPLAVFAALGELDRIGTGEPLTRPADLALSFDGKAIYALANRKLVRIDLETGVRTAIPSISPSGGGVLTRNPSSDVLYIQDTDGELVSVDPATGAQAVLYAPPSPPPDPPFWSAALIFDPVRSRLIAFGQRIRGFPLTGGAPEVIENRYFHDGILDLRRDRLVVSEPCGRVRVQTDEISDFWPLLADPLTCDQGNGFSDLAFAPEQDTAFVYDHYYAEIHAVDLATGTTTPISSPTRGQGPGLGGVDPKGGLVYDAARNVLWTLHGGLEALVAIEPISGDRVIVAR